MTTYTFKPNSSTQFVNWTDPSSWTNGVVPNSPDADVVFPAIFSNGQPYASFVSTNAAITVNSISLTGNYILVNSSLSVLHDTAVQAGGEIDMHSGGTFSTGTLENNGYDIQGTGQVNVSGQLTNNTQIVGSNLTVTAAELSNPGELVAASGDLTVNVTGHFDNLNGTTLTGGTYIAGFHKNTTPNTLFLNVGGVIATDAANISLLGGGVIESFDAIGGTFVPIQSSLHTIAASGTLSLADQSYTWSQLTDNGTISLTDATFTASPLTIGTSGRLFGTGHVGGPISNAGVIAAGFRSSDFLTASYSLIVDNTVTGSGGFEITAGVPRTRVSGGLINTLELQGAQSELVTFANNIGILQLDAPTSFNGAIAPSGIGDEVIAEGFSTNATRSYSGDQRGGTLTLHENSMTASLTFVGDYNAQSFTYSAGPQTFSTDPPSLAITVRGTPRATVHANDLTYSSTASGFNHFIDYPNFEASYADLIHAFGTNQQAMQSWYAANEPNERRIETFDGLDYIASYGDLINAFASAGSMQSVQDAGATHFITNGLAEGRSTTFNGLDYIASYGDLINAFGANNDAGALHFIENGAREGRTTTFDGLDYIATYGDLINAFGANEQAGAAHFIAYGAHEGRTTTFDGLSYIAQYTDLMNAFGADNDAGATHYITNGLHEGRSTSFDVAGYEQAHPDLQGLYSSNDAFLTAYIDTYRTTGHFLT
jgi:hypothetical protein